MSARDRILARLADAAQHRSEHPGEYTLATLSGDWKAFAAAARDAGSEPLGPVAPEAVPTRVRQWIENRGGGRVVAQRAAADWLGEGPWEIADDDAPPHSFSDVDIAIARGSLCVAENGAVAIPAHHATQRALLFLCERLILLVPVDSIALDMNAATRAAADDIRRGPCFTWMAGPSKTADIEQHLVIGAHGPREFAILGVR